MKIKCLLCLALLSAALCSACVADQTQDAGKDAAVPRTPEQQAREQFRARQKVDSSKKKRTRKPAPKKEGGFWTRHSVEKRKRLGDVSRPILLDETKSDVMPWKTSGPRSEKLHDKYIKTNRSGNE